MVSKASDEPKAGHPIAVVATRTGLSRDVIRVWERRYGAVAPARTRGGQRLYSDDDVRRFRLLAAVTRHGRNISLVAQLGTDELERLAAEDESSVARPAAGPDSTAVAVDAALEHIAALDGAALDALLRRTAAREGTPWFLDWLVPALMRAVGDGWAAGRLSVAHEHLASAAAIAVILEGVRYAPSAPAAPRILVATPSGDRHAVGAALAAAAASLEGWSVIYLGPDVPAGDIAAAATGGGARAVALSVVYAEEQRRMLAELLALRNQLRAEVSVFVGGAGAEGIAPDLRADGITWCDGIAALRAELARIA
jgi:methanogenic corrinoid protein MtbC1